MWFLFNFKARTVSDMYPRFRHYAQDFDHRPWSDTALAGRWWQEPTAGLVGNVLVRCIWSVCPAKWPVVFFNILNSAQPILDDPDWQISSRVVWMWEPPISTGSCHQASVVLPLQSFDKKSYKVSTCACAKGCVSPMVLADVHSTVVALGNSTAGDQNNAAQISDLFALLSFFTDASALKMKHWFVGFLH